MTSASWSSASRSRKCVEVFDSQRNSFVFRGLPWQSSSRWFPSWTRRSAGNWRIQCADGHVGFTARAGAGSGDTSGDRMVLRPLGGAEQDVALEPLPLFGRAGTLDAFARTVRGETPPAWVATAADNLGTLRLMEATIRSAANGGAAMPIG